MLKFECILWYIFFKFVLSNLNTEPFEILSYTMKVLVTNLPKSQSSLKSTRCQRKAWNAHSNVKRAEAIWKRITCRREVSDSIKNKCIYEKRKSFSVFEKSSYLLIWNITVQSFERTGDWLWWMFTDVFSCPLPLTSLCIDLCHTIINKSVRITENILHSYSLHCHTVALDLIQCWVL